MSERIVGDEPGDGPQAETYVFYHAGCMDGFASAWAAWLVLGDAAKYQAVQYGMRIPYTGPGARVYVLDFSYPADALMDLAANSVKVTVLDHHESNRDALDGLDGYAAGLLEVRFDMTKSGAMLAWDYFHPGQPAPMLVRYVQDQDLWAWALEGSRAFSAYLRTFPFDFKKWLDLTLLFDADTETGAAFRDEFFRLGWAITKHVDSIVTSLANKAFTTRIAGHNVPCINSHAYQNELADALCARRPDAPFAAIWYAPDMTTRIWSLRSRNGFPVHKVAEAFGGGGHPAAASFRADVTRNLAARPEGYEPPATEPAPEAVVPAEDVNQRQLF